MAEPSTRARVRRGARSYWVRALGALAGAAIAVAALPLADVAAAVTCDVEVAAGGSIQAAISSATAGQTICVAAGAYTANLTIDRDVRLVGAGDGSDPATSTIVTAATTNTPVVTISGSGSSASSRLTVQGVRLTGATGGTNTGAGVYVAGATAQSALTLDHVTATGNQGAGVAFNNTHGVADVVLSSVNVSANTDAGIRIASAVPSFVGLTVSDSTISGNGGSGFSYNPSGTATNVGTGFDFSSTTFTDNAKSGASNTHDLSFFNFNGNASLTDVTVTASNGPSTTHKGYAVLFYGKAPGGAWSPSGTVTLDGLTVNGTVGKGGLSFQRYSDVSAVSMSGVDVADATAPWGQLIVDHKGTAPLDIGDATLATTVLWGAGSVDATAATFRSTTGGAVLDRAVAADDFTIEDQVLHGIDVAGLGLVRWSASTLYTTPNSYRSPATAASLDRAYSLLGTGDSLVAQPGTYAEGTVAPDGAVGVTGELSVAGTVPGSWSVESGGTLGGTGTIEGDLAVGVGGTVAPGNSPGMLTIGGDYTQAGALSVDVVGTAAAPVAGTDYDQIAVSGDVTLEATATLGVVFSGTAPAAGTVYRIIDNQGPNPVNGTFSGLAEGDLLLHGGQTFRLSYAGGTGNDVTLTAIASQPTLTVVATTPAAYGSVQTLSTNGGSGTGAVTFSTGTSNACSVNDDQLTITAGSGTCSVTATKAASGDYLAATSSAFDVTVQPAALVVTPNAKTLKYGDPVPASYGYSVSGFVGNDTWTTAPSCTSTYLQGAAAGTYADAITCSSGVASSAYTITYNTAALTVNPRSLVVTPDAVTLTFGDPAPLTYLYAVSGDGFYGTDTWQSGPTCGSSYSPGTAASTTGDAITCTATASSDYDVTLNTAPLTVLAYQLEPTDTWYTGQLRYSTASASQTAVQVTLTASINAPGLVTGDDGTGCGPGGPSVADGTVTFRDMFTGKVFAKDVAISEVGGNCEEGIATAIATLSTGTTGVSAYTIVVEAHGSLSGTNDATGGQINTDPETATVVVSLPAPLTGIGGGGQLDYQMATSSTSLGTEGQLTTAMTDGQSALVTFTFVPGTKKVSAKGQAILVIPGDGGTYYVKSNSITSVTTANGNTGTVYAKASVWMVPLGCTDATCQVSMEGNASLRLDVTDAGELVAVTIQSSKSSALLYSNDWRKVNKAWQSVQQQLTGGTVDVG